MAGILQENRDKARKLAWLLSLGGLIPFFGLALVINFTGEGHPLYDVSFVAFKFWSLVILAFLGGIRWGFALSSEPNDLRSLALSVVGTIAGFFAIFLPNLLFAMVLMVLFAMHGAWDNFFINQGKAPKWFGSIRVTLTFLVAFAHALVLIAFV